MSAELPLLALLVFFGFLVEAAAGFGGMVIALTVGALWLPMGRLLGVLVPVNLALSAYLLWRGRRAVDWRFLLATVLPPMGVGLACGVALTRVTRADWLKPVFGLFVVAVAAQQLAQLLRAHLVRPLPVAARTAWLLGGGFIHGVFATGGPPTVYVASRALPDKAAFRSTLSAVWVVLNLLLLPRLWLDGSLAPDTSALLLAPLAVGIVAGELIHRRLDERKFKLAVSVLLLAAGSTLLLSSARGWWS